jgi:hypothetical protein
VPQKRHLPGGLIFPVRILEPSASGDLDGASLSQRPAAQEITGDLTSQPLPAWTERRSSRGTIPTAFINTTYTTAEIPKLTNQAKR